ncbi:MAG: hypothetical protein LBJ17_01365 [Dysgonamonadaceae bacterium]|nr:hypothetical protein [Dysgonamonadaceae bacterium]
MKTRLAFLSSALLILLTSCMTVSETEYAYAQVRFTVYSSIPLAPEVVLTVEAPVYAAPGPNYAWIDGYWTWDYRYREYIWVQGHWDLVPYSGAYWIPGYWDYTRGGYRWIDACWLPDGHNVSYGYYAGRYDYYGRPVYYHRPGVDVRSGFAYTYDHRTSSRGKGYSSSRYFNDEPRDVRNRETKEFYRTSESARQVAATRRSSQDEIRIREDNTGRSSSTSRESAGRTNVAPSRTGSDRSSSGSTPSRTTTGSDRSSSSTPSRTTTGSDRSSSGSTPSRTTGSDRSSNSSSSSGSAGSSSRSSSSDSGSSSRSSSDGSSRSSSGGRR